METFNDLYGLSDDSYYNPRLDQDEKRFLNSDRFARYHGKGFNSKKADICVSVFMETVFNAYITGEKAIAHNMLSAPREINETRIGYGKIPSKGRGTSFEILDEVFETLLKSGIDIDIAKHRPPVIPILTPNFDKDRLSDLLTNICSLQLVEFTEYICKKHKIRMLGRKKVHYFDPVKKNWAEKVINLPVDTHGRPILLLPKDVVVEDYPFSAGHFVWNIILTSRQYKLKEQGVKQTKRELWDKEVRPYGVDMAKSYALDQLTHNPKLFDEYLVSVKRFA